MYSFSFAVAFALILAPQILLLKRASICAITALLYYFHFDEVLASDKLDFLKKEIRKKDKEIRSLHFKLRRTEFDLNRSILMFNKEINKKSDELNRLERKIEDIASNYLQVTDIESKLALEKNLSEEDALQKEKNEKLKEEYRIKMNNIVKEVSVKAMNINLEKRIKRFKEPTINNAPEMIKVSSEKIAIHKKVAQRLPDQSRDSAFMMKRSSFTHEPTLRTIQSESQLKDLKEEEPNFFVSNAKSYSLDYLVLQTFKEKKKDESISLLKLNYMLDNRLDLFGAILTSDKNLFRVLKECPESEICQNLMLLLFCLKDTPIWLYSKKNKATAILLDRVYNSDYLKQSFFYAGNIRLYKMDKKNFTYLEDSLDEYNNLFVKKRKKGFVHVVDETKKLFHPFFPVEIKKLKVEKVFNSNTRPLLIKMCPVDKTVLKDPAFMELIILKSGDDLRRDMAVMLIFKLLNCIWSTEGYVEEFGAVEAKTYNVLAINEIMGVIEYVKDSFPILELSKYQKRFTENERQRQINTAAGGTIASFILGIKDRHDDNTLFCMNGNIFQIDFSYMMGEKVTLDTAEISITRDTKRHFGEIGWNQFVEACIRAFCTIRNHHKIVLEFSELVLAQIYSKSRVRSYMEQTLMLNIPYDRAVKSLRSMLKKAPSSYRTRLKNVLHHTALAFSKKESNDTKNVKNDKVEKVEKNKKFKNKQSENQCESTENLDQIIRQLSNLSDH